MKKPEEIKEKEPLPSPKQAQGEASYDHNHLSLEPSFSGFRSELSHE